ncbi:MAG: iron-containing redox enzyme family protein [Candidatus Tectomicrobia bacterium]
MNQAVYLNAFGTFLPGEPLDSEAAEQRLGWVGARKSPTKRRALKQNKIVTRHYALDEHGDPTHRNYEMAAQAISQALERSQIDRACVDYLATATTMGDLFVPGFASLVQREAQIKRCEIASFHGVCASSMAALKAAYTGIAAGEYTNAVVCGSEFSSRQFRASVLADTDAWKQKGRVPLDADFLRWMLSDGAGAVALENRANVNGLSLKIEWIDQRSNADTMDTCMYAGGEKGPSGQMDRTFSEFANYRDAVGAGMFMLRQDLAMLEHIVPMGVAHYLELVQSGKLKPDFDWFLCHYSSHIFKQQIVELLEKSQASIAAEKWFTNLYSKGNTGAASIFIMLEELYMSGRLRPGHKIVCQVPESGQFITSFMLLTVEGFPLEATPASRTATVETPMPGLLDGHLPESDAAESDSLMASLMRRLFVVWTEFERDLNTVPLIQKINRGTLTKDDYRLLLLNLRQQVMEGSRWISRAASNLTVEYFPLRSKFIKHSADEHRDFKLLEDNFVALGGERDEILDHPRNIGSEALSAYMFHSASQENPFHLIGSMFIIEGLGQRLAQKWGKAIQHHLNLSADQVSFLRYHGENDAHHIAEMVEAFELLPLSNELNDRIVKAAKVTGRLYRLQLEELGNY